MPFITQERVGRGGTTLRIRKIRSMPQGTEETMSDGHYDSRRTPIGKFISATRIDEAPQLLNVLGGSMSAVGLRPLVGQHHEEFMESIATLDEEPERITDPYLKHLKSQNKSLHRLVQHASEIAPNGWFDPYGIEMYAHGKEDTHEARARSNIQYAFETASLSHDLWVIGAAVGVIKNLRRPEIVLPDHNPQVILPHQYINPSEEL